LVACSARHSKSAADPAAGAWPKGQMPAPGETGLGPVSNPRGSIEPGQCSAAQPGEGHDASDPLLLIRVVSTRTKEPLECVHVAVVPTNGGAATRYATDTTGRVRVHLPAGNYRIAILTADCAWCRLDGEPLNVVLTAAGASSDMRVDEGPAIINPGPPP